LLYVHATKNDFFINQVSFGPSPLRKGPNGT